MKQKIAVVTGASSGFGREFVKLMLKENLDEIWIVSRNKDKLEAMTKEFGTRLKVYPADLSDRKQVREFEEFLKNKDVTIKYLINNAGYAKFCSYDEITIDESINMIDLNISAVVAMGLVCIPYMERGSHIINVASQAAFQPLPWQNIYSSTKAFVRNYSRALNIELKEKGILVTAVCPGWMKTNLYERGNIASKKGTKRFVHMVMPDVVAKKALKDAKKGKDMSVYGAYVKMCHLLAKLLPQSIMMKIWLLQQK